LRMEFKMLSRKELRNLILPLSRFFRLVQQL
jgi:hypothetical protein